MQAVTRWNNWKRPWWLQYSKPALLFCFVMKGPGIYNKIKLAALLGKKTLTKVLDALPAYEVEELYVCADALGTLGVQIDPSLTVKPINLTEQQSLISTSDAVITAQP